MLVTGDSSVFTGQSRVGVASGWTARQIFSHRVEPRSDKAVVLQTLLCFYRGFFWWLQSKRTREKYQCRYIAEGSSLVQANRTCR
jgi:hypothetical protein